jgi:PPK2 family polyphosphate:nucleotide phosphotransferase
VLSVIAREEHRDMRMTDEFIVKPGSKVRLREHDPDNTLGFTNKKKAKGAIEHNVRRLEELQYLLYAENERALLVILQALDAGGKDGTIRHVMGPLNPQGCRVASFKVPTEEELSHDFLWRIHRAVPRKGEVGIFNRSHYEDVLVVRVRKLVTKSVWSKRYEQINAFERTLTASGVHIVKFFLHISKDEQRQRFKERLEDPTKHWKVNPKDFEDRALWDGYVKAYEEALSRCSTPHAPWFIIPSNCKWFRNLAVSQILVEALEALDMRFPEAAFDVSAIKIE